MSEQEYKEPSEGSGLLTLPESVESRPAVATGAESPHVHGPELAKLLGFRFVFSYFLLYNIPYPLEMIPGLGLIAQGYTAMWHGIVPFVGSTVLRLSQPAAFVQSGSGDKLYDYVWNFTVLLLALVAALAWTAFSRRREHARAKEWLRLYVRLALGAIAISYGSYKVIKSQFPAPMLEQLAQPVGNMSPMGLLWTFMGFSPAYNLFTGAGELLGGVLLFFRRTTLAGALVLVAVLSNVVVLNYTYDVPVKLYSTNLLLMAIWLAANDGRRLLGFFLHNRATEPAPATPLFASRGRQYALDIIVKCLLGVSVATALFQSYQGWARWGDGAHKPPLYGLYETQEFTRNGQPVAPLLTDTIRWKRITFPRQPFAVIRLANDSVRYFSASTDTSAHTVTLTSPADSTRKFVLSYRWPQTGQLSLAGVFRGDTIGATFRRRDESSFLLLSRGYHWVQTYPYNR